MKTRIAILRINSSVIKCGEQEAVPSLWSLGMVCLLTCTKHAQRPCDHRAGLKATLFRVSSSSPCSECSEMPMNGSLGFLLFWLDGSAYTWRSRRWPPLSRQCRVQHQLPNQEAMVLLTLGWPLPGRLCWCWWGPGLNCVANIWDTWRGEAQAALGEAGQRREMELYTLHAEAGPSRGITLCLLLDFQALKSMTRIWTAGPCFLRKD